MYVCDVHKSKYYNTVTIHSYTKGKPFLKIANTIIYCYYCLLATTCDTDITCAEIAVDVVATQPLDTFFLQICEALFSECQTEFITTSDYTEEHLERLLLFVNNVSGNVEWIDGMHVETKIFTLINKYSLI